MITLTETAANRVSVTLKKRGKGIGIRVGVKTTGCSGLAYVLEYVDNIANGDVSFVSHGIHIVTDPKSIAYLTGLEMDWVREGLNEGFKFNNPNVKDECGCGESFRV